MDLFYKVNLLNNTQLESIAKGYEIERNKGGSKPETGRCSKLIEWKFCLEESDVAWVAIVILKSLPKI